MVSRRLGGAVVTFSLPGAAAVVGMLLMFGDRLLLAGVGVDRIQSDESPTRASFIGDASVDRQEHTTTKDTDEN